MEEDRNPQIKVDWGINDIRILHDAMECYISKEIDYEKTAYEKEHVEGMKRTLYQMILEFNYHRLNSD